MFFDNNSLYDKFFLACLVFTSLNPLVISFNNESFRIVFLMIAFLVPSYFLLRAFKGDDRKLDEFIKKLKEMDDRDE